MTQQTTRSRHAPARDRFAARFRELGGEAGRTFSRFIADPEPSTGRLPCWGELARRFDSSFTTDEARVEALAVLLDERDLRGLLLFAHASRRRVKVLDALFARASELPVTIQRALLTMVDTSALPPAMLDALSPSAQQLLREGETALAREREIVEARVAELLSFGIVAPDSVDPRSNIAEPGGAAPETTAP